MKNDNATLKMPKCRFPEFLKAGEWEYMNGNKVFETISNKVHNSDLPILAITQDFGAIPRELINYTVIVTDKSVDSYKVVEIGDFIISLRSFQGGIEYSNYKGICSPAYIILRKKRNLCDLFFKYYFKTNLFINDLNKNIEGIRDGKMVSFKQFSELELPIPSLAEQQKIAACLSSLDEWIAAQTEQVAALQWHKKGLLQQLFPAAGETIPRLRFPAFEDAGEWTIKPFSEVYSLKVTNCFSRDALNYVQGRVKNIHYGDIHTKFSTLFDITKEIVPYINPEIALERIQLECYCQVGDLIFADASEDVTDVGKSIEIIELAGEKLVSGLHTLLARQIKPKLITGFGGHLFRCDFMRSQIQREAQGAKVSGISGGRLLKIKICYPKNKAEQQQIAACLSAIDARIAAATEQLAALKMHKKGLMQQLFPRVGA